jgi:hypothetical protein
MVLKPPFRMIQGVYVRYAGTGSVPAQQGIAYHTQKEVTTMSAIIFEDRHHTYSVFDLTGNRQLGTFGSLLDASSWCYRKKIPWRLDLESLIPFQLLDSAIISQHQNVR